MRSLTLVFLAACGSGSAKDADTAVDSDSGLTATGDTFDETCEPLSTASTSCASTVGTPLVGTLVGPEGEALGGGGFIVQYCRDVCYTPLCEDGNSWAFGELPAGPGSFKIKPNCEEAKYAPVFAPIDITGTTARTIAVTVPKLGPDVALPDAVTELEVTGGLYLSLSNSTLTPPALEPAADSVSGVNATDVAIPIEGIGEGEVLAVYYLSPFDYTVAGGIPVRLDNAWSLASGEAELWFGHYNAFLDEPDTSPWQKVGTLSVDGDGKLVPDGSLPQLTTLVVFKPTVPAAK